MTDPDQNANLLTLRQDKNAQQACILYQILQKTEIFDAFNNFCDVFRENSMEYREFEFFFYQLGKENAELGSELRFNPKSRQLLELPDDMLNKIFDCVKPIELFPIRKVSRRFRDVIDSRAPGFKKIELNIANFCLSMNFDDDDEDVQYSRDEDEDEEGFTIEYKEHETHVARGSVVEAGLSDLYRIMKNPKFSLETLDVTFCEYLSGENLDLVENIMKKLKSIQVTAVILRDPFGNTIDHVLPYLEPEKLEDIHFEAHSWLAKCDRVIQTKQFKFAKRFFMDEDCKLSKKTRLFNFFHLVHFTISVKVLTKRDAMKIKNILMKKPGFKTARIYVEMPDPMEILKVFYPKYSEPVPPGVCFETQGFKLVIGFNSDRIDFIKVENFDFSKYENQLTESD